MNLEKPSLNQLSSLMDMLKKDETLNNHWQLENKDEVWQKLEKLSLKQYRYFLALIFNQRRIKLNALLEQLGLKRK